MSIAIDTGARNFVVQKNSKISVCDAWPHRKKSESDDTGVYKGMDPGAWLPSNG